MFYKHKNMFLNFYKKNIKMFLHQWLFETMHY